jgi:hypothetical protein
MSNFYFILFLKRLDADEKLQYFQLPRIEKKKKIDVNFYLNVLFRFRICKSLITLQATCHFTFNKSGYIFPYVDSVYYTQLSHE